MKFFIKRKRINNTFYSSSYWELVWKKFKKHRLGNIAMAILFTLVFLGIFAEFFSPVEPHQRDLKAVLAPPQLPRFWDKHGFSFRPFVYATKVKRDPITLRPITVINHEKRIYLYFFSSGFHYKLLGIFPTDIHLVVGENGEKIHFLGTDDLGRDLFSRLLYATRISLSVGVLGVIIAFVLALIIGGVAGYFGGIIDFIIQRVTEVVRVIPVIPLYMGLAAAFPKNWSSLKIYFAITLVLGFIGWPTLARRIRSQFLALKNEDYVLAAKIAGAKSSRIIARHLMPNFISYIIVDLIISFPYMILAETALSFIGLGLRPPIISWGVLLQTAQRIDVIANNPILLFAPFIFVFVSIISFVIIGDALRDAADPYKH